MGWFEHENGDKIYSASVLVDELNRFLKAVEVATANGVIVLLDNEDGTTRQITELKLRIAIPMSVRE